MAKIVGIEGWTVAQVQDEVQRGGTFVTYLYCVSVLVMTFRRSSDVHFIRAGESRVVKGIPFTRLSFAFGWWGIPWGLIYTPHALFVNLSGGKDVTSEVMRALAPVPVAAASPYDLGLNNPW